MAKGKGPESVENNSAPAAANQPQAARAGGPGWTFTIITILATSLSTGVVSSLGNVWQYKLAYSAERNTHLYDLEFDTLRRRMNLLERFSQISRKDQVLRSLSDYNDISVSEMQRAVRDKSIDKVDAIFNRDLPVVDKYSAYRSEYLTVIALACQIFGPQTRSAMQDIIKTHNPDIWNASEWQIAQATGAMSAEINYDLPDLAIHTTERFTASGPNGMPPATP